MKNLNLKKLMKIRNKNKLKDLKTNTNKMTKSITKLLKLTKSKFKILVNTIIVKLKYHCTQYSIYCCSYLHINYVLISVIVSHHHIQLLRRSGPF